eukprot:1761472-Prymnesium_polylepis.1
MQSRPSLRSRKRLAPARAAGMYPLADPAGSLRCAEPVGWTRRRPPRRAPLMTSPRAMRPRAAAYRSGSARAARPHPAPLRTGTPASSRQAAERCSR